MTRILAALAALAFATPAFAQGGPAPAEPAPPAAAPAMPAPEMPAPGAGKGAVKALFASCRAEAASQGLRGPAKRDAVSACVVRQRPDLAGRMECRKQGFDEGLRKEELHAFVRQCLSAKG